MTLVTVVLSCAPSASLRHPESARAPSRHDAHRTVIVIALDGVRWQDVFLGVDPVLADRYRVPPGDRVDAARLVPSLHRLMTESGAAVGAPSAGPSMHASGPNFVSLPGYMEMLTGRADTGCTTNRCGTVALSTIADDVARAAAGEVAVVTSWPRILRAASANPSSIVASAGRHGGVGREVLERDVDVAVSIRQGEAAGPAPGRRDFRPDARTEEVALAYLESRVPAFLFVGLGDTDEYGHKDDYRGYLRALSRADAFVGRIAEWVARRNGAGFPATLFVTTDHGRSNAFWSHGAKQPESSRVWLVAAGAGIAARGFVASPRERRLADVAQTIRRFYDLPLVRGHAAGAFLTELAEPTGRDETLSSP